MKIYNITQITDYYFDKKYTITKISKVTNIPISTIKYQLKKHGYSLKNHSHSGNNRKHFIDVNFFKSINNKYKAYLLGLIISDGYVDDKYKVVFTSKDHELVSLFKNKLKSEHKLGDYNIFDKRTNKTYKRYSLQIASKKIVKDLNKLGIYSNKSFNCMLPIIPDNLMWHFIRGVFDGDGTIYQEKNKNVGRLRFEIIGSEKMLIEINKFFKKNNILNVYIRKTKYGNSKGNLIKLDCSKFSNLNILKNKIYEDSNGLRLTRKYELFQTLKEYKLGTYDRTKSLRKIKMCDYLTNKHIKTFQNIHDVCDELNTTYQQIHRVANGERNHTKGYGFKYC